MLCAHLGLLAVHLSLNCRVHTELLLAWEMPEQRTGSSPTLKTYHPSQQPTAPGPPVCPQTLPDLLTCQGHRTQNGFCIGITSVLGVWSYSGQAMQCSNVYRSWKRVVPMQLKPVDTTRYKPNQKKTTHNPTQPTKKKHPTFLFPSDVNWIFAYFHVS